MNKAGFLVLGTVMGLGSFLFAGVGCGGGTEGTGGTGGTGSSTSSTSSSTASSTGSTMSSSSTGGGATLDCKYYCTTIAANCKDPATTQYKVDPMKTPPDASCMNTCAGFPAMGKLGDTSGDTLGCRIYHAEASAMGAMVHCPHAGPTGGDKDVTDANPADPGCGEGCDAFCAIQAKACTGANQQYADIPTCMAECKMFPANKTATYSTANVDKNDFGCRMYHLSVAATDAAAAGMHCGHIKMVSATCIMP